MKDPLEDIFYVILPESLFFYLEGLKIEPEILVPVQVPKGSDCIDINLEQICSAILKLLVFDSTHEHIDYYKGILLTYTPEVKEDALSSALKKMEEKDYASAEFFLKILMSLAHVDEDMSFVSYNLAICLESQVSLFLTLDRKREAQEKIQELKDLYYLFSSQKEFSDSGEINKLISLNLVQEKISEGREEDALREITKIVNQYESSWDVWFLKGWILRKLNRYSEALECFEESRFLSQPKVDILMEEFICFMQLEKYSEAEKILEESLILDKEDSRVYFNFGLLFYRIDQKEKALSFLEKGLSLDPQDSIALNFIEAIQKELKGES